MKDCAGLQALPLMPHPSCPMPHPDARNTRHKELGPFTARPYSTVRTGERFPSLSTARTPMK